METEHANLVADLERALDAAGTAEAGIGPRLAGAPWRYRGIHGDVGTGRAWVERRARSLHETRQVTRRDARDADGFAALWRRWPTSPEG